MKEMNLLPIKFRYDYSKVLFGKLMLLTVILNVVLLVYMAVLEVVQIRKLSLELQEKKQYVGELQQLNERFSTYEAEYAALQKKFVLLKEQEEVYQSHFQSDYSPMVSSLIFLNSLTSGIEIKQAAYDNGRFVIEGTAENSDIFYRYYKRLESNRHLMNLNFYHYQSTEDAERPVFDFKLKFAVRRLNEVY